MPIGPLIAPIAGALLGAGLNTISNNKQNKASRQHEIDMYHMQNEYNTPQAQMQRLKQGGLNPNLVYGQSSGGAAGQAASPHSPQFKATDYSNVGSIGTTAINTYYDTEVKKAQVSNLERDNTVKEQEALLKAANVQNVGANTKKTGSETEILDSIKQYSGDAAAASLAQTNANIEATITDTQRKQAMHAPNMQQAIKTILLTDKKIKLTEAQINSVLKDVDLKQQEKELADKGIYKGDAAWIRLMIKNKELIKEKIEEFIRPFSKMKRPWYLGG